MKEIANRDVPVVCDPTLLFTGDEWMAIQQKEPIVKGKYILCYFLGNNPPHREFAKRLKEATGCKIIALTHLDEFVKSDEGYADETPYDIDPADFSESNSKCGICLHGFIPLLCIFNSL